MNQQDIHNNVLHGLGEPRHQVHLADEGASETSAGKLPVVAYAITKEWM
jgi:hypothetical protein